MFFPFLMERSYYYIHFYKQENSSSSKTNNLRKMAYLVQCQEANPEYVAPRIGLPMNSILLKWLKKMKNIPLKKS